MTFTIPLWLVTIAGIFVPFFVGIFVGGAMVLDVEEENKRKRRKKR